MSSIWKRMLSLVLAMVMVFGSVPMQAFATENDAEDPTLSSDDTGDDLAPESTTVPVTDPTVSHTHDYQSAVTLEATCTQDGVMTYTCSCEDVYTEVILATGHSFVDGVCACGEVQPTEAPSLSGEVRKVYFLNNQGWSQVYGAWAFDEEYFEDAAFPGLTLSAEGELENVWVISVPVEADDVLFSDGVEVTDALLAEEEAAGLSVVHEIRVRLNESRNYYDAVSGQWLNYADVLAAYRAAKEDTEHTHSYSEEVTTAATCEGTGVKTFTCTCGEFYTEVIPATGHSYVDGVCGCGEADPDYVDPAVAEVQAMINALPTSFGSDAEINDFWNVTTVNLDTAIAALTPEQQAQLDQSRYDDAIDAAAAYVNPEFNNDTTWATANYFNMGGSGTEADPIVIAVKDASSVSYADVYEILTNVYGQEPESFTDNSGVFGREKTSSGHFLINDSHDRTEIYDSNWGYAKDEAIKIETDSNGNISTGDTVWYTWITNYSGSHTATRIAKRVQFRTYYQPTVSISGVTGLSGTVTPAGEAAKIYAGENNAVLTIPYVEGYTVSAEYNNGKAISLKQNGTINYTGTFTAVDSSAVSVIYKKADTTGTVALSLDGSGSVVLNNATYTTGTTGVDSISLSASETPYSITVTPAAGYYVSLFKVDGVEVTAYNDDRSMNGSLTVKAKGEYTIEVVFSQQSLTTQNATIGWNPAKTLGGYTLDELEAEIIDAVITETSVPGANAVKENYTVQFLSIANNYYRDYVGLNETYSSGSGFYNGHAFGADFESEVTTEQVKIVFKGNNKFDAMSEVTATVTLSEWRTGYTLIKPEMSVAFDEQSEIDNAVLSAVQQANAEKCAADDISVTIQEGQTLPSGGQTANLIYNVTVKANANHLGCTDTVTIAATANSDPAKITFVSEGEGSGSFNFGGLTANGTLVAGTYTLTVTPGDLDGSDGSATYVDNVTVSNATLTNGGWENGVYTASITVSNDTNVTVTIKYDTASLTKQDNAVLGLNGYVVDSVVDDYSARFVDLKKNIIDTVLGGGTLTDYNVHVWIQNPVGTEGWGGDPRYFNLDDTAWNGDYNSLTTTHASRFVVPAVGSTGTQRVKIIKAANGQIVELTLETEVATKESRLTTATFGYTGGTKTANTPGEVTVANTEVTVTDESGKIIGTAATVTNSGTTDEDGNPIFNVTVKEDANFVSGITGTITVPFEVQKHQIKWLGEQGQSLFAKDVAYGTDANEFAPTNVCPDSTDQYTYTYVWSVAVMNEDTQTYGPTLDENGNVVAVTDFTVTGPATYILDITQTVKQYTITFWDDENGNGVMDEGETISTGEYDYGTTAAKITPANPSRESTNTVVYTFKGWEPEVDDVTANATYKAVFEESDRAYTVTFKDYDGRELGTSTVKYGEAATAPANPTRDADETYTYAFAGWDKAFNNITADDVVVTATYTSTFNNYTVQWIVDGVEYAKKTDYHYNDALVVPEEEPSKEADDNYTYSFKGWDVNGDGNVDNVPSNVTENATFTAVFSNKTLFNVTLDYNDGVTKSVTTKEEEGSTYTLPADPSREGYTFLGWYVGDTKVEGSVTINSTTTTIEAKWEINQYTITFDMAGGPAMASITQDYGTAIGEIANPVRTGYTFTGWNKEIPATMPAEDMTITASWSINQYTVTFVTDSGVELAKLTQDYGTAITAPDPVKDDMCDEAGNLMATYTFANWDKEIPATMPAENMTITASFTEIPATYTVTWSVDGNTTTETYNYGDTPIFKGSTDKAPVNYVQYTFTGWDTAPAKVVANVTYTAQYSAELQANNGEVEINKYYTNLLSGANALTTLRTDILTAAGLPTDSNYVVTALVGVQSLNLTWTVEINDGEATVKEGADWMYNQAYLADELDKASYTFTITETNSGVSKDVTMQMVDSRETLVLNNHTDTVATVYNDADEVTAYVQTLANSKEVNPSGVEVTIIKTSDNYPTVAGEAGQTTMVYTITHLADATYKNNATATITVLVQTAYSSCTVTADDTLTAGGSMAIYVGGSIDLDGTVPGNSTVEIRVTPTATNSGVDTIVVKKNGTVIYTFETKDIKYGDWRTATVSFMTDGSKKADAYEISATYSTASITLNEKPAITYCVDVDSDKDLKTLIFNAVYASSNPDLAVKDVTIEYSYGAVGNLLWTDVNNAPSFSLGNLTHKFGEDGTETIRITYKSDKYGTVSATVDLIVYDTCYNNTVTITGADNLETSITGTADPLTKEYDTTYYKQNTDLTITVEPKTDYGAVLGQYTNGTYASSNYYIESITVDGVEQELTRGKLLIGSSFNAAVTIRMGANTNYDVAVTYAQMSLAMANEKATLVMYPAGEGYAAVVPSSDDLLNTILGKDYAENFLKTYGGAFTVEFSNGLIKETASFSAVTDDALLALEDGETIFVRITWKPADNQMKYYPLSVVAEVTLSDNRTATVITGSVPETPVEFRNETEFVANLKTAMSLGVAEKADGAVGAAITNAEYKVTFAEPYEDNEVMYTDVTVIYDGTEDYKPAEKKFERVPVSDVPDYASIEITVENDDITASVAAQNGDPVTKDENGVYTVTGENTYTIKLDPDDGKAVEAVTITKIDNSSEVAAAAEEPVILTYKDQVATFSLTVEEKFHYEVKVETVDSVFVEAENRTYDFAYGIDEPAIGDIVGAAISYPESTAINYNEVEIQYLARESGKVTVDLGTINLGIDVLDLGSVDVELGELWLTPGDEVSMIDEVDLQQIVKDLIEDTVYKFGMGELTLQTAPEYIYGEIRKLTIGAHAFGANGDGSQETIRISYEDEKFRIEELTTDVTIHDYRIATELKASDCEVTFGYSLNQLIAAAGAEVVKAEDGTSTGLAIATTNGLYLHADGEAQQVKLYFAGDEEYQPCETVINVTVNKATCSIDYDSQYITYGDDYSFAIAVAPAVMPDGTTPEIDMIEFMIGVDMNKLLDVDIEDKDVGLNQAIGYIQLRLPETIRELPVIGDKLQGEMTLGGLVDLLKSMDDILGIDDNSMGILEQVVEAITGITDNMDIKIIIDDDDFHPTNIGVYIAGAVTVDNDFKTAYTADYLIIAPKTVGTELEWDYVDENGIMTLPVYNEIFKDLMGAHVVETETVTGNVLDTANSHIKYLILGVSDETSEFLTTDIYGNIKANIWTSNDAITDNGAYVQIAYMLNWGNEIYYAKPIVRSFVIVPGTVDVQLVDADGEETSNLLKTFNNEGQGFNLVIADNEGTLIYSDVEQNAVDNRSEYDELTWSYIGVQTNGKEYNSSEKPVHAGAYVAVATLIRKNANGDLLAVGADTGILVIEPTEATINVENVVKEYDGIAVNIAEMITASSSVAGLVPDTTVITAGINTDGTFSENGLSAIEGDVNVDFPKWVDEYIAQSDTLKDGMSVADLKKIVAQADELVAQLAETTGVELDTSVFTGLNDVLDQIPESATVTFKDRDEISYFEIGTYLVVGVVTDSDHYPTLDAGLLMIYPDAQKVTLDWIYEDSNNIFTKDTLKLVDLGAKIVEENINAQPKVLFLGVEAETFEIVLVDDQSKLNIGTYDEIGYLMQVDSVTYYAEPISRVITVVAGGLDVKFIDENGDENNDRLFTYDGEAHPVETVIVSYKQQVGDRDSVVLDTSKQENDGNLTFYYTGVQTNGVPYASEIAPTNAGTYSVTATYVLRDEESGRVTHVGAAAAVLVIEPAEASISVDEKLHKYDGNSVAIADMIETTTASGLQPDTTIITAQINTDGTFSEEGLKALTGNVNIDFPEWVDEILSKSDRIYDGIGVSDLIDLIEEADAFVSQYEIEGYELKIFENLMSVLSQLDQNAKLTFKDTDELAYSAVGSYLVVGVVTDSNYYPAMDAGVLVIYPNVELGTLEWKNVDSNHIFYLNSLTSGYLDAKALFDGVEDINVDPTEIYIGVDANNWEIYLSTEQPATVGVYTEIAVLNDTNSYAHYALPIIRPVIIVDGIYDVLFHDENGNVNHDRLFTYDGTAKEIGNVYIYGYDKGFYQDAVPAEDELKILYIGSDTTGDGWCREEAPTDAGVYTVIAVYTDNENGEAVGGGAGVATMVIAKADMALDMKDTTVTYDGESHFVDVTSNAEDPDYLTVIVDKDKNTINFILEDDLTIAGGVLKTLLEEALGRKLDGEFSVTQVQQAIHEVIDAIEAYQIPDEVKNVFDQLPASLKDAIQELKDTTYDPIKAKLDEALALLQNEIPQSGTVIFNGDLPVEVGEYQFYGFALSANYEPEATQAVLTIEKAIVEVPVIASKIYNGKTQVADVAENNLYTVTENKGGINVGEYDVVLTLTDSKNYKWSDSDEAEKTLVFEITECDHAGGTGADHNCDHCGEKVEDCYDEDPKDHQCDECGEPVGEHKDSNIDHECDYGCGETIGECVDSDKDHSCDYGCGETFGTCEDTDKDHACDYGCDKVYGTCEDADKDHACDYGCGKVYGTCEDADKDHDCDYGCNKTYGDHADGNDADHDCDYCHGSVGESCYDENPKDHKCDECGETVGEHKDSSNDGDHVCDHGCGETLTECVDTDGDQKCDDCGADMKKGMYPIPFTKNENIGIAPGAIVEIDGVPYILDENCIAWVEHTTAKIATTYTYHAGENVHETYPNHMYVWYLTIVDKDSDGDYDAYTAERIEELDDFFKYEGTSIRINFTSNGIRFFTSVNAAKCAALMNGTLLNGPMEGFRLTQAGTLYKRYTGTDSVINIDTGVSSDVYGGKAGKNFRVFSTVGDRNWFTGMLTGLDGDAETLDMDIQSRPFAVLTLNGETIVLYGGTVQRSIYYVATQNRDYWAAGTVYDNYVESLIATVEESRKKS